MSELREIAKRAFELFSKDCLSRLDSIDWAIEESDILACDDTWDEIEELFFDEMGDNQTP
jgi:hypothetical protein